MGNLRLQSPHKTSRHNDRIMSALLGISTICSVGNISQWYDYDFQPQPEINVESRGRAVFFEPLIKLPTIQESYLSLLRTFLELEDGWDGYDAVPLQKAAFDNASDLINALSADVLEDWTLFPSDNGSVLMVLKKRVVATVNVGNTTVSYVAKSADGEVIKRGRENFSLGAVVALVSEIAAALR